LKIVVVYYSKTENTKSIAEIVAEKSKAKIIPINLLEKKGRGTEEERKKYNEKAEKFAEQCLEKIKST
jgi:flavodoxin